MRAVKTISLLGCVLIFWCVGCGSKRVSWLTIDDIMVNGTNVSVIFNDLQGLDRTPFYSESKDITFTSQTTTVLKGALTDHECLTNFAGLSVVHGKGNDRFFLTTRTGSYLRNWSAPNEGEKYLQFVDIQENRRGPKVQWTYQDSLLPRGEMVMNRSRSLLGVDSGHAIELMHASSGVIIATNAFPNFAAFSHDRLSRAFLSEAGSHLFIQEDSSSRVVLVLDRGGGRKTLPIPFTGWLIDAEATNQDFTLIFKDAAVGKTRVMDATTGKIFERSSIDSLYFDALLRRVIFYKELGTDGRFLHLQLWNFETDSFESLSVCIQR